MKRFETTLKFGLRSVAALLLLTSVSSLVGCDHFFGHDQQVQDPLVMKDQGLSCVRSVGSDITSFMSGDDRDPVMIVDCLSSCLTKFADNTRGANADGWTRGELSSFFETYFKAEASKSDATLETSSSRKSGDSEVVAPFDGDWVAQSKRRAVVTELFRWKATLFGGAETTLSRTELNRIREILRKVRFPLSKWRGRGKILAMNASALSQVGGSVEIENLNELTGSIRDLSTILTSEIDAARTNNRNVPMKLEALSSSLEQAGIRFLEPQERKRLVQAIKFVGLAGDPQIIAGDEWSELVRQAAEIWIAGIRIKFGVLQNPNAFYRDLDFVETTALDLRNSVARMIQRHGGRIANADLRTLITRLEENKLLPEVMKAKTANEALEFVFGKLLAGNSRPNQAELKQGLHLSHLERAYDVVHDWAEGQRVAIALLGPAKFSSVEKARDTMSLIAPQAKDAVGAIARVQMSELILRGRPMIHDKDRRLLLSPNAKIEGYLPADLESINLSRVLMSAALRGYSHEAVRAGAMPQITEAETQELFMDMRTIGRDLGIVDVRSLQAGIRTFMENNIFLSISDGNETISLHEMVEWFETVMSAGRDAEKIHEDFLASGLNCGTAPADVFGKQRLKAQCFRDGFASVLRRRLDHLPTFINALNVAEQNRQLPDFITALERATRSLGNSDLPVESSDIRVMAPVIYYIEALFERYDVNRTNLLEAPEVWSVFPLIRPFIQKVALDEKGQPIRLSTSEERAIFAYLLEKGEPPKPNLSFKLFEWTSSDNESRARFSDVVRILASFQNVGRMKKNTEITKFYVEKAKAWEDGISAGDKKVMDQTRDLFQCAPEASADLTRLLQTRRTDIFAVNPKLDDKDKQALEFTNRLKSMIQADPQLQLLCLAF